MDENLLIQKLGKEVRVQWPNGFLYGILSVETNNEYYHVTVLHSIGAIRFQDSRIKNLENNIKNHLTITLINA